MHRRNLLKFGLGSLIGSALPASLLQAEAAYPKRTIKLVVPFAPGGLVDTIGRLWADRINKTLGTTIVENEGGAGGALGAATVARAPADGYTLLLGNSTTQVLMPLAMKHPSFKATDFEAVSIICVSATCIVVNPALPIHSLKELIDYAKANPGKLSYGSAGAGSMTNLAGELFKHLAGTPDIVHIPYRGAAPGMTDLMSGQIPMMTPNITAQVLQLAKAGKVRILAVNAPARLSAAPDIPTAIEAGLPGMELQVFNGVFAPAKTDGHSVGKVSAATQMAVADPEFRARLIASGFEPVAHSNPAAAQAYVASETTRLAPVIKAVRFTIS